MTAAGVWVVNGPGLPCGARELGGAGNGRTWLDVCVLGQHLPQMYRREEIRELTADGCARLGLCSWCLGFGDEGPPPGALTAARGIDQWKRPCPGCGGSGRPVIRASVTRDASGVTGSIRPLPHDYVPPLEGRDPEIAALLAAPEGMCLACGMPQDGTGPRGEALHQ